MKLHRTENHVVTLSLKINAFPLCINYINMMSGIEMMLVHIIEALIFNFFLHFCIVFLERKLHSVQTV